jgi:hypothetical protein
MLTEYPIKQITSDEFFNPIDIWRKYIVPVEK